METGIPSLAVVPEGRILTEVQHVLTSAGMYGQHLCNLPFCDASSYFVLHSLCLP